MLCAQLLVDLSDQLLTSIGITSYGHRHHILKMVRETLAFQAQGSRGIAGSMAAPQQQAATYGVIPSPPPHVPQPPSPDRSAPRWHRAQPRDALPCQHSSASLLQPPNHFSQPFAAPPSIKPGGRDPPPGAVIRHRRLGPDARGNSAQWHREALRGEGEC